MIKNSLMLIAFMLLTGSAELGGELVNTAGASGIAVGGYEPVAFFTEKKPVHGDPGTTASSSVRFHPRLCDLIPAPEKLDFAVAIRFLSRAATSRVRR